jgi:predicted DNA-binding protein
MTATVRLDEKLETTLNTLSKNLHKKKSDIIREAIAFYAKNIELNKKTRILSAIQKTKDADKIESKAWEGTLSDGI